jgi:catechol 2,3-dioxygenase-like lactoylglutathione lyase family enzyme
MQLEHTAINVPDSDKMAKWYVRHCRLRIVTSVDGPPFTRFLADQTGRTCLEIYTNPAAPIPDYAGQDPLVYHHAFAVSDPEEARDALLQAGATLHGEDHLPDGSRLIMMRDPWGIPLQLVRRMHTWY